MSKESGNRFSKGLQTATDNTSDNAKTSIKENAKDNILSDTTDNIGNNILDDILKSSKKDRGKNHTIYLSADVSDALEGKVKESGMSKSELVDKILRRVLLNL